MSGPYDLCEQDGLKKLIEGDILKIPEFPKGEAPSPYDLSAIPPLNPPPIDENPSPYDLGAIHRLTKH